MSEARFKVTYKPEGFDEPEVWVVDLLENVRASEMIAVKKVCGIASVAELLGGLMQSDLEAMKALLWMLLKRKMSTLSYDSLDFTLSEIEIGYDNDDTDAQLMRKLVRREADGTLNEAGVRKLAALREAGVEPEGEEDPKA